MYKYSNKHDKVAFPVGGMGAGMFTIKSTGALADFSLNHSPDVKNDPIIFAAVNVKAKTDKEHLLKVLPVSCLSSVISSILTYFKLLALQNASA